MKERLQLLPNDYLRRLSRISEQLLDLNTNKSSIYSKHPVSGKNGEELVLDKNETLLDILEQKKLGNFPIDFTSTIKMYPDEIFHPLSRNKISFEFPFRTPRGKLLKSTSSLNILRRNNLCQNSEEAIKLINNYNQQPEGSKDYAERTLREIQDIANKYAATPNSIDKKTLRELIDNLAIDRLLNLAAKPEQSNEIKIDVTNGEKIRIVVIIYGIREKSLEIEGPRSLRYSETRNNKLSALLNRIQSAQ